MSEGYEARIAARRAEADGLIHLELDVARTPLATAHAHPGQYVKVKLDGVGESYFALASAPGPRAERFDLLVKTGAPLADALAALEPGAQLHVSVPQGKGFPLGDARGKDVLLVATGSGISAIRSAVEAIRADRAAFRSVTLYFGARTPDAFAYQEQLGDWEKDRIRVYRVVSRPPQHGWSGLAGYVQSHLAPVSPDTVAFLCGQKAMVQAVTELLEARGIPRSHIHLNF